MAEDEDEARRQDELADLAAIEAYLILTSAASGDVTLATTELRWDLAVRRVATAGGARHAESASPSRAMREAVLVTAGPEEEPALTSLLMLGEPHRREW
jgi:hypothetical protein